MRRRIAVFWLAGFALGFLVLLPHPYWVFVLWAFVAVETGHVIAPIALGWVRLRDEIWSAPVKWIGIPATVASLCFVLPFSWVFTIFAFANTWHFGMQNFGVLRLLGIPGHRYVVMGACLLITGASMQLMGWLPKMQITQSVSLAFLVSMMFSFNHWLTDLGLTKMAALKWWPIMLGGLLIAGCSGYLWMRLTSNGVRKGPEDLMRFAYVLNFNHFLYSRWVWQRGRELLAAA